MLVQRDVHTGLYRVVQQHVREFLFHPAPRGALNGQQLCWMSCTVMLQHMLIQWDVHTGLYKVVQQHVLPARCLLEGVEGFSEARCRD